MYPWIERASIVIRRIIAVDIMIIFVENPSSCFFVGVRFGFFITITVRRIMTIDEFFDLLISFEVNDDAYRNKIIIPVENVITITNGIHLSGEDS